MGRLPINSQMNVVVVDPRNPKNVFAAGIAGVFRSNDAGLNWESKSNGLENAAIVALAQNPTKPDTLFASTENGKIFRSDDGAQSWQFVSAGETK